jgi:hypothetical protein
MSDPRAGSVATETAYFTAPGTGVHLSRKGSPGNVIVEPSTGAVRSGDAAQFFVKERADDQSETAPSEATARTCHQYVPFGTTLVRVPRVFFVKKWSYCDPRTGALNPASAAISNSYRSAPDTMLQPKAGRKANESPSFGVTGTGTAGALPAGPTQTSATVSAASATRIPDRRFRLRDLNGSSSPSSFSRSLTAGSASLHPRSARIVLA